MIGRAFLAVVCRLGVTGGAWKRLLDARAAGKGEFRECARHQEAVPGRILGIPLVSKRVVQDHANPPGAQEKSRREQKPAHKSGDMET